MNKINIDFYTILTWVLVATFLIFFALPVLFIIILAALCIFGAWAIYKLIEESFPSKNNSNAAEAKKGSQQTQLNPPSEDWDMNQIEEAELV